MVRFRGQRGRRFAVSFGVFAKSSVSRSNKRNPRTVAECRTNTPGRHRSLRVFARPFFADALKLERGHDSLGSYLGMPKRLLIELHFVRVGEEYLPRFNIDQPDVG